MGKPAEVVPARRRAFRPGLFKGIEVVNGDQFYPEALRWAAERRSDVSCVQRRSLANARALEVAQRPITLVFARSRNLDGVKEALVARRTLAWLDRQVWGNAALLRALWVASVTPQPAIGTAGAEVQVSVQNTSAIAFDLHVVGAPTWLTLGDAMVAAESTTVVRGRLCS